MIDVKQAVAAAMKEAVEFYDEIEIKGLQLEEVEKSKNGKEWLVTLSFFVPDQKPPANVLEQTMQSGIGNKRYERKYKVFKVETGTGSVTSMKIREE